MIVFGIQYSPKLNLKYCNLSQRSKKKKKKKKKTPGHLFSLNTVPLQ